MPAPAIKLPTFLLQGLCPSVPSTRRNTAPLTSVLWFQSSFYSCSLFSHIYFICKFQLLHSRKRKKSGILKDMRSPEFMEMCNYTWISKSFCNKINLSSLSPQTFWGPFPLVHLYIEMGEGIRLERSVPGALLLTMVGGRGNIVFTLFGRLLYASEKAGVHKPSHNWLTTVKWSWVIKRAQTMLGILFLLKNGWHFFYFKE